MKSLKTLLQEVTAGIKAWANANFSLGTHVHGNISSDGKVGTTANKPLITGTGGVVQAGSFGNQANTFCEGNDSRLSDARTPVAHTHATSEVLKIGSAFTGGTVTNPYFKIASWEVGANQYFGAVLLVQNLNYPRNQAFVNIEIRTLSNYNFQTGYLYLSNDCGISKESLCICYKQESNKLLCELYYYDTAIWNGISFSVLNESLQCGGGTFYLFQTMTVYNQEPTDAVANLPAGYTVIQANYMPLFQNIIPGVNNTYDLGTSTNKWKSVYSDSYYYGTTAWGLDKANEWTGRNTFSDYSFTGSGYGFVGQGNRISYILPEFASGYSGLSIVTPDFNKSVKIGVWTTDANTGKIILNQSGAYLNISAGILDGVNNITITPRNATNSNIGDSNNKWKTLNGINPGALSLPSSNYVEIDTTGWDLTGATYNRVYINNANPTFPGILFVRINSSDPVSILVKFFSTSGSEIAYSGSKMEAGSNNMIATAPCPPNTNIYVQIETTSTITVCRYYTLLGDPEFNSRSSS